MTQPTEITSLFNYLQSKQADIIRMMEAVEEVDEIKFKPRLEDRDPRKETAEDWAKIQNGMSMNQAARERGIGRSQIRRRLQKFGYKK